MAGSSWTWHIKAKLSPSLSKLGLLHLLCRTLTTPVIQTQICYCFGKIKRLESLTERSDPPRYFHQSELTQTRKRPSPCKEGSSPQFGHQLSQELPKRQQWLNPISVHRGTPSAFKQHKINTYTLGAYIHFTKC